MILTGDAGIIILRRYKGIPIMTVSGLFRLLNKA